MDKHEPVAWRSWNDHYGYGFWETKQEAEPWCSPDFFAEPIYTAPPQKEWVGLTDEEIQAERHKLDQTAGWTYDHFARAIESKLKQKNVPQP